MAPKPVFFATPSKFRAWLERYHQSRQELWVGFYKKSSGKPSLTWPESVDEALCFGWIDGLRKSIDEFSYTIRFTPRKPRSIWSAINIKRAHELHAARRMGAAGLRAFAKRSDERSAIYSYEQRKSARFEAADEQMFRANQPAWTFFQNQPPGYRKIATYWVTSAKKESTRAKRLAILIECSARGESIRPLKRSQ
ncbi:MAG: YdeI/OmpD-associated family protein [Terriglobales bacterium]